MEKFRTPPSFKPAQLLNKMVFFMNGFFLERKKKTKKNKNKKNPTIETNMLLFSINWNTTW